VITFVPTPAAAVALQSEFLLLLPVVRGHAQVAFRHLPDADREEAVADAVANAWQAHLRLTARGKQPACFRAALARFAALGVCYGRHVGRSANSRDVMARFAQRRRGIWVQSLDAPACDGHGWWRDAVADSRAAVPRQAAFRIDFPNWLRSLPPVKRWAAVRLARGHATHTVAVYCGVSAGRVAQIRRELAASWFRFHGERHPER
jgi:hypothetical protein